MTDFELETPFVTVTSKGGPHDDQSYVCGYEMGLLDNELKSAKIIALMISKKYASISKTLHLDNKVQAELIAMKHGWTIIWKDTEVEGWVYGMFAYTKE